MPWTGIPELACIYLLWHIFLRSCLSSRNWVEILGVVGVQILLPSFSDHNFCCYVIPEPAGWVTFVAFDVRVFYKQVNRVPPVIMSLISLEFVVDKHAATTNNATALYLSDYHWSFSNSLGQMSRHCLVTDICCDCLTQNSRPTKHRVFNLKDLISFWMNILLFKYLRLIHVVMCAKHAVKNTANLEISVVWFSQITIINSKVLL